MTGGAEYCRRAFTLLELLVVVAIIGVLVALLSPAIEKSVERSRLAVCGENLHVLATGMHMYASEFNDALVVGPASPSGVDPTRPYNRLGDVVAWIGASSQPNGLGILNKGWVTNAKAFLCPFNDDPAFGPTFLKNMGTAGVDAYSSYIVSANWIRRMARGGWAIWEAMMRGSRRRLWRWIGSRRGLLGAGACTTIRHMIRMSF